MDCLVTDISVAGRKVGANHPCFIIAEAGVNHNGSLEMARQLVDVAVRAGADAVKFQTFKAEKVVSATAPKAEYQLQTTSPAESQLDMIRRLELPSDAFRELQAYCHQQGILFISSPFDHESADLLDNLKVPAFKIGSGEITNLPLLAHVARKGRPMLVSTGMSTLDEVAVALDTIRRAGASQLVLLHCVSNYPANPADANLHAMNAMADTFQVPVGFSDHTQGITVAVAAVALGACILEKHFTLDRTLPGPDHLASLEPRELRELVEAVRTVTSALGDGRKQPAASEANTAAVARRSLVAARHIAAGTRLTQELIAILRPGTGLPPAMRDQLVGRVAKTDIPEGTLLNLEMLK
jgi:N-acetylneuraminate synthase/N,N'-diacetyllegionaminate synthase